MFLSEKELKEFEDIYEITKKKKHSHYYKKCPYQEIDVYRVLELFNVTNPCIAHAAKKLLVAGGRGSKDISQDVQEAIDTLERFKEMRKEEKVDNVSENRHPGWVLDRIEELRQERMRKEDNLTGERNEKA